MSAGISAETAAEVAVAATAAHGHDPTWDSRTDTLLWTDRPSRTVHRFRPRDGDAVLEVPGPVSGAKPRSRGGLALHLSDGLALYANDGQERTWLAYWARDGSRGEATAIDALGRLWASTLADNGEAGGEIGGVEPDNDGSGPENDGTGSKTDGTRPENDDAGSQLLRIDPNARRRITTMSSQAIHGLAWSPNDTELYRVCAGAEESSGNRTTSRCVITVSRFDLGTGSPSEQRPLCAVEGPGKPRGLCVDAEGLLWLAMDGGGENGGEIRRYTPEGVLDIALPIPARRPTGCCFGGPDLTDLYVTSAREGVDAPTDADGALLVLPNAGTGSRSTAFAG